MAEVWRWKRDVFELRRSIGDRRLGAETRVALGRNVVDYVGAIEVGVDLVEVGEEINAATIGDKHTNGGWSQGSSNVDDRKAIGKDAGDELELI